MDLDDVVADFLHDNKGGMGGGYDSFSAIVLGFVHAVDWANEPWLQALLGAQAMAWVVAGAFRSNMGVQCAIFAAGAVTVLASEAANEWGAAHWKDFAGQNYFDKHGVFLTAVLTCPLLVLLLLQVLNALYITSWLLIKTKVRFVCLFVGMGIWESSLGLTSSVWCDCLRAARGARHRQEGGSYAKTQGGRGAQEG